MRPLIKRVAMSDELEERHGVAAGIGDTRDGDPNDGPHPRMVGELALQAVEIRVAGIDNLSLPV